MNYEQKYKEALERAKDMMSYKEVRREDMEYLFPELKESEDERIRKELINFIKSTLAGFSQCEKYIAWLEKQRDKPLFTYNDILALQCCMETVKKVQEDKELYEQLQSLHDRLHDAYWLEKQSDVDNADKVEPKFEVGDFIANDYCRGKIVELTNDAYLLDTGQGMPFSYEHNIHLWTIEDAKEGDVLAFDDCIIAIFKDLHNDSTFHSYCYIDDGEFFTNKDRTPIRWRSDVFHPATKEQRDLLFQKMKEAGYEWDANKKELIKL